MTREERSYMAREWADSTITVLRIDTEQSSEWRTYALVIGPSGVPVWAWLKDTAWEPIDL